MKNGEKGAYPAPQSNLVQKGLTKREYFAGLAMQGLLASDIIYYDRPDLIKDAIKYADELLKQLENK